MMGTDLQTRARMYGIPDFESEIKPAIEAHMAMDTTVYPLSFEDLIGAVFPDRDFNETKAIKNVLYAAVKINPKIVGTWFQPSYRGSRPPHDQDGSHKYPKWAEIAIAAGSKVEFLKEGAKRRRFGPPKALMIESDLSQRLQGVQLGAETTLKLHEAHTMLARASVQTLEAVCTSEGTLGGEIRNLSIAQDALQHNFEKVQRERELLFNNNMDMQQRLTEKDEIIRARDQLVAELQEQVIALGGTPILQAGMRVSRTSVRPQ